MKYIFTPSEPDYAYIKKSVCSLQAEYPFLKVEIAGRSTCGRKIFALRFGRSANSVLIAACFHAQERLTALVTLRFTERLCLSAKNRQTMCGIDIGGALSRREIIFVPCVNPDGVEIALHGAETAGKYRDCVEHAMSESHDLWNANARGVDLNHNFNAGWDLSKALEIEAGITAPAPRRFGGYAPQTEPEVNALVRLCLRRMPRTAVALHSQGEEGAHAGARRASGEDFRRGERLYARAECGACLTRGVQGLDDRGTRHSVVHIRARERQKSSAAERLRECV